MPRPDNRPQDSWRGEELEVTFTARAVKAVYRVPAYATWTEIEKIELDW